MKQISTIKIARGDDKSGASSTIIASKKLAVTTGNAIVAKFLYFLEKNFHDTDQSALTFMRGWWALE
jgi:hypothetical protein